MARAPSELFHQVKHEAARLGRCGVAMRVCRAVRFVTKPENCLRFRTEKIGMIEKDIPGRAQNFLHEVVLSSLV
jgi:hypothetical protein